MYIYYFLILLFIIFINCIIFIFTIFNFNHFIYFIIAKRKKIYKNGNTFFFIFETLGIILVFRFRRKNTLERIFLKIKFFLRGTMGFLFKKKDKNINNCFRRKNFMNSNHTVESSTSIIIVTWRPLNIFLMRLKKSFRNFHT